MNGAGPSRYRKVDVPSAEENMAMVRRAQAGDLDARNECVERNMPLVRWIARRYSFRVPAEDLEQEGVLALIRAIERFQESRGVRFEVYAFRNIRARLFATMKVWNSPVHVPYNALYAGRVKRARMARDKGYRDRCEAMSADARRWLSGVASLSDPDGDSLPRPGEAAGDTVEHAEDMEMLRRGLAALPAREAEVVRRRYGLGGEPEMLKTIGESFGRTRQWVHQVERKAIAAMWRVMAG